MIKKKQIKVKPLLKSFFERDTLTVAKELLGKYLIRKLKIKSQKPKILVGKIVETEAYIGEDDLACHASKGKTPRTQIMYGEAGHTYIYMIYGMYHCLNIVTERIGFPAAVLIRALEPILCSSSFEGQADLKKEHIANLRKSANGPGKLCRWMEITRKLNGVDMTNSEELYLVASGKGLAASVSDGNTPMDIGVEEERAILQENFEIVETKRIGVDYAKHCAAHPWRFYIKGNEFVSKK